MNDTAILFFGVIALISFGLIVSRFTKRKDVEESLTMEISPFSSISGLVKYKCDLLELGQRHIELHPQSFKPILDSLLFDKYNFNPRDFYSVSVDKDKPTFSEMIDKYLKEKQSTMIKYPVGKHQFLMLNIVFKNP